MTMLLPLPIHIVRAENMPLLLLDMKITRFLGRSIWLDNSHMFREHRLWYVI